jgi:hypothetical protein
MPAAAGKMEPTTAGPILLWVVKTPSALRLLVFHRVRWSEH